MPFVLNWQDAIPEDAAFQPLDWREEGVLSVTWIDEAGEEIGESFELLPPLPERRETTDGAGNFVIQSQPRPVALPAVPPAGATELLLRRGQTRIARFERGALKETSPARVPDMRSRVPLSSATAKIYVVSECYPETERQKFFDDVAAMRTYWITNFLPFQNSTVAAKLSFEALFWSSDRLTGNFATHFPTDPNDRIVKGKESALTEFLAKAGISVSTKPFVLVLVNSSSVRGGAGGNVFHSQYAWQAAWVTTHSNAFEDWRAIALHELGHSFGLMDEYETEYCYPKQSYEPNVSPVSAGSAYPELWRKMLTESPDPPGYDPLVDAQAQIVDHFLGARYTSNDYYRPSLTCLMRSIGPTDNPVDLCPVCSEVIARKL